MKCFFKSVIFFLTILSFSVTEEIQAKPSPPELFAVCEIIVEDSSMMQDAFVRFDMNRNNLNSSLVKNTSVCKKKIDSRRTSLTIPLSTALNYGRISFFASGKEQPFNYGNNLFLFQHGDTVQIYVERDWVEFKGKSSDKFTCMYRIQESMVVPNRNKVDALLKQGFYAQAIAASKPIYDSAFAACMNILKEYKGKIDPKVMELIVLDCKGFYDYSFAGYLYILSNSRYRKEIFQKTKRALDNYFPYDYYMEKDPELLARSYRFCYFLLNKEIRSIRIQKSSIEDSRNLKHTFHELFSAIQKNYDGIIRDKLLLNAFYLSINRRPDLEGFHLDSALNVMGTNIFKMALQTIKERNTGSDAFPFELENEKGKIYRLRDFKGKLLIMHFWFTGCHGCAGLAEQLKPIIESYQTNSNVVFVTVNVDKGKERWMNSLKTEKYSSKDEINLYAGGGRYRDHPMLKYYNIIGFPTVIFISKEGEVISTNPPRPATRENVRKFKELIDKSS